MELIICSDVSTKCISISDDDLHGLDFPTPILLLGDKSQVEKRIDFTSLINIEKAFDIKINKIIESLPRETDKHNVYTKILYKNREVMINYRIEVDFFLGILIGVNNVIYDTIKYGGTLYVFNKIVLSYFKCESVLSILKVKGGLTENEIYEEINTLSSKYESVGRVEIIEITSSIEYLLSIGVIGYDEYEQSKLKLTSKGYLLG